MTKKLKDFKAAIIDLDGTVLDSLGVWQEIDRAYLEEHGLGNRPEIVERLNKSSTLLDAAIYLNRDCAIAKEPETICNDFEKLLEHYYKETLPLLPHAKKALAQIKALGIKTALVTASNETLARASLSRNGVENYFDYYFCNADKLKESTFAEVTKALGEAIDNTIVFDDLERIRVVAEKLGYETSPSLYPITFDLAAHEKTNDR